MSSLILVSAPQLPLIRRVERRRTTTCWPMAWWSRTHHEGSREDTPDASWLRTPPTGSTRTAPPTHGYGGDTGEAAVAAFAKELAARIARHWRQQIAPVGAVIAAGWACPVGFP